MPLRLKTALFVDFDNIFIGLKQDNPRAAEEFGHNVRRWLDWIVTKMAVLKDDDGNDGVRDILVRRCYGNPETFGPYRGYFTRSGFSVVDCPALTTAGKNSADIVMVMDILDVLNHQTRFDEFIIMSADADFTPLLLRLRMHDRHTVAIVAGNAAAAYKASCDLVVSDDVFVDDALQVAPGPPPARPVRPIAFSPKASPELLDAIAARVYEEASAGGEVAGSRLPAIFREFKEFTPRSNWLGFFTLRSLTEALVARRPELRMTDEDEWNVVVNVPAQPATAAVPREPAPALNGGTADLRSRIVEVVRGVVAEAREPVVMARVAHAVIKALGPPVLESQWAGAGTFKHLLEQVDDLGLAMVPLPQPGYIFDPKRHQAPSQEPAEARPENLVGLPERLSAFIRRIAEVTGAPRLSPAQYAVLFELIAKEVEKAPYDLTWTSKAVRDQALERGENLSRLYVSFVLRGIGFSGYTYRREGTSEAPDVARAFHGNVINLLRGAQVVLTDEELGLLDQWLLSAAEHAEHAPPPAYDAPDEPLPAFAGGGDAEPPAPAEASAADSDSGETAAAEWAPPSDEEGRPEARDWDSATVGESASEARDWESPEVEEASTEPRGWGAPAGEDAPRGDSRDDSSVLDEIAAGSARWEPPVPEEIRSGASDWEPLAGEDDGVSDDGPRLADVHAGAEDTEPSAEPADAAEPEAILPDSGRSWFSKWLRPDEEEGRPAEDSEEAGYVAAAADDEPRSADIFDWSAPAADAVAEDDRPDDAGPSAEVVEASEPVFDAVERWRASAEEPRDHAAEPGWEAPGLDAEPAEDSPVAAYDEPEAPRYGFDDETEEPPVTATDDAHEPSPDTDADDLPWLSSDLPRDSVSPESAEPVGAEASAAPAADEVEPEADEPEPPAAPPSWLFPPFPAGGKGQ